MKKTFFVLSFILILPIVSTATIRTVDINGHGNYTSIQTAIQNSANGDTIIVWPGLYNEQLNISKSVIILGSGFEVTTISSNSNPTIIMQAGATGKILWFDITSNAGNGISLISGVISNCVIRGCASNGIYLPSGSTGLVINCDIIQNGNDGILSGGSTTASVVNTISYFNYSYGFYGATSQFTVNFCDGSLYYVYGTGNINSDPLFVARTGYPADLHLSPGSPCFNTGKPDLMDPDFTQSDMGYFGGPDCPVFPIVSNISISVISAESGTMQIQVTGKSNY